MVLDLRRTHDGLPRLPWNPHRSRRSLALHRLRCRQEGEARPDGRIPRCERPLNVRFPLALFARRANEICSGHSIFLTTQKIYVRRRCEICVPSR